MIVQVAFDAGHGRLLHHEIGERHFDVAGVRLEALGHLGEQAAEGLDGNLALAVQDLHEARHVRAFEVVRQVHVHVEVGHGVLLAGGTILHLHGVIDVLDADLVDRNLASVGAALHVFDGDDAGVGGGSRVHVKDLKDVKARTVCGLSGSDQPLNGGNAPQLGASAACFSLCPGARLLRRRADSTSAQPRRRGSA